MEMKLYSKLIAAILLATLSACSFVDSPKLPDESAIYEQPVEQIAPTSAPLTAPKPLNCVDQLGCAKYKNIVVKHHPAGFGFRCFTQKEIFGDAYPVYDELLATGRVPLAGYNLRWSDSHSFPKSDFPKIVNEAKRFVPIVNKYPNVGCEFSGATEHQLNARDAQDLANRVLAVIPERCTYVNNPWEGRGSFIPTGPRIKNEVHGKNAHPPKIGGRFNWSADGSDIFDINATGMKNRMSNAEMLCDWTSQNNGKRNAADTTPRGQRVFWPTPELETMLGFVLATDQGKVNLPQKYLVKPKSDQHSVPPGNRELKPVLIFPVNDKTIQLRGGDKIYTSAPGQVFADGRTRYYFAKHGHQMVNEARTNVFQAGAVRQKRINGKMENVWVKFGTTNPGFRQNEFR